MKQASTIRSQFNLRFQTTTILNRKMSNHVFNTNFFKVFKNTDSDYSVPNTIHRHISMKQKWKKKEKYLKVKPQGSLSMFQPGIQIRYQSCDITAVPTLAFRCCSYMAYPVQHCCFPVSSWDAQTWPFGFAG